MLSIIYLMFQHFHWCENTSNSFDIEQTFTLYQKKFWTAYSLHLLAAQPQKHMPWNSCCSFCADVKGSFEFEFENWLALLLKNAPYAYKIS